jgi:hypothetical protein
MKKNIYSLVIILLSLSIISCSSDDDSATTNAKTIKKIEEKIYYNGQIDTQYFMNFNYNNGVLTSLSDNNYRLEFVYNGDKIIETKRYYNNQFTNSNFLIYENSLLKTIILDDQEEQTNFTYQNGKLNSKSYSFLDNGAMTTYSSEIYQIVSNNIVQTIYQSQFSTIPWKRTFDFDAKNSMMKNMNPYLKYIMDFETIDILSENNPIKSYSYDSVNSTQGTLDREFVITYDVDNYPTVIKKYNLYNNNQQLISEMIISYN